jgi:hypothetical protein
MDQRVGSSSRDTLAEPVPGGYSLTTSQRESVDLAGHIPGWGSDLDRSRRPGVPRDAAPGIGVESLYPPIPRQSPKATIHKSTEHGRLTPVFGTSCPPRGLSGRLRDVAYRFSEGRLAHWLTLMFADRVDVVENTASELLSLRVPNVVKEMGLKSEWQYNRAGLAKKAAVAGLCVAACVVYSKSRSRSRRNLQRGT